MKKCFLGIDIGSTTLKAVLLDEECRVLNSLYKRTKPAKAKPIACSGRCFECGVCNVGALKNTVTTFLSDVGVTEKDVSCTAVTGSQIVEDTKNFINYDYKISEVTAHVAGAKLFYPDCKAILDVGGQDSKSMIFNDKMDMWTSKMSGICAAGTGAFLDSVAVKLAVPVEEMAIKADLSSTLEFSSVCAVLSATSINKFKNRYPIGEIIGGACRAQARTIMSGVGELFYNYKGRIVFQGGVAYNKAVCECLKQITGNDIVVPEYNGVMGALGAACIAKEYYNDKRKIFNNKVNYGTGQLKSISLRAKYTRKDFMGKKKEDIVWRNLFFPTEILNALDAKMLTLETYAALFARNRKKVKNAFDVASYKGFTGAETCSFLRILEGIELPKPAFALSTSQPCLQGERIFNDLIRSYGMNEKDHFYSLHTPTKIDSNSVDHMAADLEKSVYKLEKALGKKMDPARLVEACEYSNQARDLALECTELRFTSPPLLRGSQAVYFASMFSQLWGTKDLVEIHRQFKEDLLERKAALSNDIKLEDTHRLLWLHLPPFYDSRLLDYIELECNMPIVFEEVNSTGWDKLDINDPYRSLARKLLTVGFLDPQMRVKKIKQSIKKGKFNGCVLYNHMFGRCSMADASFIKHLREELNDSLVPLLVLDGDCIDPTVDPCSTYTKINAYAEALNTKKIGNIFGVPK
jgi:activator of 2-hydroxyglutaryl-CoA dehydratase/benzoyl-CoA reductase/2-hydroxyglutaryl-CoA dehydratase subunit BcrC/BadD/HgdB